MHSWGRELSKKTRRHYTKLMLSSSALMSLGVRHSKRCSSADITREYNGHDKELSKLKHSKPDKTCSNAKARRANANMCKKEKDAPSSGGQATEHLLLALVHDPTRRCRCGSWGQRNRVCLFALKMSFITIVMA